MGVTWRKRRIRAGDNVPLWPVLSLLAVVVLVPTASLVWFMTEAIDETARWTTAKIRAIRALVDQTAERMRKDLPKIYSRELVETIFAHPCCRIGNLVDAGIAQRQSASTYLKAVANLGLLQELKAGREKLYLNVPLLDLLAERA